MPRKPKKSSRAKAPPRGKSQTDDKAPTKTRTELPSKTQILDYIARTPHPVGKREIARKFHVKGGARIALKRILAELAEEGAISNARKQIRQRGILPPVTVIQVSGTDAEGDLLAYPARWDEDEGKKPLIRLLTVTSKARDRERAANIGIGDKVLANVTKLDEPTVDGVTYEASAIKRLAREDRLLLGIFRAASNGIGGSIEPINRKALRSWIVDKSDIGKAKDGDLVRFELSRKGRFTQPRAKIVEPLGNPDDERQISLIAIHAHGLPDTFPKSVIDELNDIPKLDRAGREDLTKMPLITIDPPDARDHDDAVYAEPDTDPKNEGGHVVWVAIADVAHYVRPESKLDREALKRANSVYFPDRVVPMLPEKISNDLCSLREGEERPCMAVRMVFDDAGKKRTHRFFRALMRSHAKLAYAEAQDAIDGKTDALTEHLLDTVLRPLWNAYGALKKARIKRSPLDLDLPERKIILDKDGRVDKITVPDRLDAHKLIEEFMIQANVAAAETLEEKNARLVYRRHDTPSDEKLNAVRDFLETINMKLPPGGSLRPQAFNKILQQAKDLPIADLVNEVVLRSQAQAEYHPENSGHFGLNLARYAHFTSPIRRYADLVVHRALITALNLGDGGFKDGQSPNLVDVAKHISETERVAMTAERETIDRLIAKHLSKSIGSTFKARVAGVTRSGLFVRLDDTGADGFVPISTLEDDYYDHVEEAHALVGQRTNLAYRMGDRVEVKLVEAIPAAGALRFQMLSQGTKYRASANSHSGKRATPRNDGQARKPPSKRHRRNHRK